jgi:P4 family phage/plasmid primase-like protien
MTTMLSEGAESQVDDKPPHDLSLDCALTLDHEAARRAFDELERDATILYERERDGDRRVDPIPPEWRRSRQQPPRDAVLESKPRPERGERARMPASTAPQTAEDDRDPTAANERTEMHAQLDKLATLAAAAKITPEQYAALGQAMRDIEREIGERYERFRELLTEHTPGGLELDEDATAAYILVARYGSRLRRVAGSWRAWDGRRWLADSSAGDEVARGFLREIGELFSALSRDVTDMIGALRRYSRLAALLETAARDVDLDGLAATVRQDLKKLAEDIEFYEDASQRKALAKVAERLTSARGLSAALAVAETLPQLKAEADAFDSRRDLLNCANGVVALRTGELLPHDPAYMITRLCPHDYLPDATAPRWEQFLAEVHPDPDVRAYVSRHWGYRLTGEMREQEFTVLLGPGGDGKSTEQDLMAYVFGPDYAAVATHGLLVDDQRGRSKDAQNATVEGARFVTLPEWPRGAKLDLAHIKHITGGTSYVAANRMRENTYRYIPTYKIVISANALPEVELADATKALWSRARLIRYTQTFRGTDRDDRRLTERLRAEASGTLAWAVREARAYYTDGLPVPKTIRGWIDEWRASVNHIAAWIDERCDVGTYQRCEGGRLFADYREWALGAGVERPMSTSQFYASLSELGYGAMASNQKRYRVGIELRRAFSN